MIKKESWYEFDEEALKINNRVYLKTLERIFKVKDPERNWVSYKMTPHQKEYHSTDLANVMSKAQDRIVVKSRNTSFTTSTLISLIMAAQQWDNHLIPIVRLNIERAKDLIKEMADIIKNMNIVVKKNSYFPFDIRRFEFTSTHIKFPNGSEIRAFPANNQSAETIRGARLITGLLDECNFMKDFKNIFVAMQDASAGTDTEGNKFFQINLGTTLKGVSTPFYQWYLDMKKTPELYNLLIYKWPVFNPKKVNVNKSLVEQKLVPIVPWHNIQDLEIKRLRNFNAFLEEYMCMPISEDTEFIKLDEYLKVCDDELLNDYFYLTEQHLVIGIDYGRTHDFTSIVIWEKTDFGFVQRYIKFYKNMSMPEQKRNIRAIFTRLIDNNNVIKVRMDETGIGLGITEELKVEFGNKIDPINFAERVPGNIPGKNIRIKEKMAENMRDLIVDSKVKFINDDIQIRHITSVNIDLKSESNKFGHSDSFWANAMALLPSNYRAVSKTPLISNYTKNNDVVNNEGKIKNPYEETIEEKMQRLRRLNG